CSMDSAVANYNEKGPKFAAGRSYQGNAGIIGDGTNSTGAMELINFGAIRVARPDRYDRLIRHRAKYLQALRPFQQNRLGQAHRGARRAVVALGLVEDGGNALRFRVDQVCFSLKHGGRSINGVTDATSTARYGE